MGNVQRAFGRVACPRRAASVGAVCALLWFATAPVMGEGPRVVVKERSVDLGRMQEGDKGTVKFTIENQGDEVLLIDRVYATCGCTIPKTLSKEERTVQPGGTVNIEAVFDSQGRRGRQRKSVTVTSNDPAEPTLKLFITAEVVTLFEVLVEDRPAMRLGFGEKKPGELIEQAVDLLPTEPGQTLEVTSLEIRHSALTYSTEPTSRDDRTGVRVRLRVDPDASVGPVATSLLVTAKVGEQRADSSLALNGDVVGVLSFLPTTIKRLQPALPGTSLPPVSVSAEADHRFEILSAEAGPCVETAIERESANRYSVKLRIRDSAPTGPFGSFVDIRTNMVEQPLIRVPLFASVQPWVEVGPAEVVLRGGGSGSSRLVKIESSSYAALEIAEVSTDSPYVTAKEVQPPGRTSRTMKHIRLAVSGDPPRGVHSVVVRVKTNVAEQPEVRVPVTLLVE